MSTLVLDAIARAGLAEVAYARHAGDLARVRALAPTLETADLLALGALADRIRAEEVGDVVRVYANVEPDGGDDVVEVRPRERASSDGGMAFLRAVAAARITGPRAARVRVDWSLVGLELAQVALGFGGSELVGPILYKRGLPIADDAQKKVKGEGMVSVQRMKQREIAGLVLRCHRRPVMIGPRGVEIDWRENAEERRAREELEKEQQDA